ncbi:MAG: ABC transporter permease [Defluviitaleaceae bacterium]|nr:ABC transporter permease [Defluviitaleaceae bacterium]
MAKKTTEKKKMSTLEILKREFSQDIGALIALGVIVIAALFVIIVPLFIDQEYMLAVNPRRLNQPPSATHWLGTEIGGRDVFALLAIGARSSLSIALAVTLISGFVGISLGVTAGYFGGKFDNMIMRIVDFISTLPALVMIIAFLSLVSGFNVVSFTLIMSFFSWAGIMRLVRARAIQEKELEYIQASKTLGTPHLKTIFKELFPNISSVMIVNMTLATASNVGLETGLSFLGFGFPFDEPSLGSLISAASNAVVLQHRWWIWLPAALFVLILMLSINTLGRTLNRATDARLRRG